MIGVLHPPLHCFSKEHGSRNTKGKAYQMTDLNRPRFRVFYGWYIVGACLLIWVYIGGVISFGFTAVFEPIVDEFHWSYAQVSLAASLRGLEAGLLAPLVGLLVDRVGPRRLIFTGATITGLGLLLLGRINSLATFYGVFILIATGISTCIGIVPMTVVGNWFRKRVSLATGIVVSGTAIGGLLVPLVTRIIDTFKWRGAMTIFGLGAWGILLPLSLLVRHKPEQYGYLPDGEVSRKSDVDESQPQEEDTMVDIGVRQALKSRAFWHIALGIMCHFLVVIAVITHVMPYLSTVGIARSTSSLVAMAIPLISICGRLSFGWFGDRFDKRRVTAVGLILIGLSTLFFSYVATVGTWLLVLFVTLFGIGYGGPVPMSAALVREHFGTARLGTILGLAMGVTYVGSIVGPPLAGWVYDTYGSYQGAWFALAGVAIAGMVSFLTAPSAGNKMGMVSELREKGFPFVS
jgi:sugar phosphate permease